MGQKPGTTLDKAKADVKKRTILTPQQRIDKAKAEVAALEAKVVATAKTKLAAAEQQVKQDTDRVAKAQAKLDASTAERDALKVQAGVTTEDPSTDES